MDNVIKIKEKDTEALIEAVMRKKKNVHLAIYDHNKGISTYILTTPGIQDIFDLGMHFGMALRDLAQEHSENHPQGK